MAPIVGGVWFSCYRHWFNPGGPGVVREKVSFINENTPRAPTGPKNTRKPARLAILE
jgi:hypothetical protein